MAWSRHGSVQRYYNIFFSLYSQTVGSLGGTKKMARILERLADWGHLGVFAPVFSLHLMFLASVSCSFLLSSNSLYAC
jgi:hypothetical protein